MEPKAGPHVFSPLARAVLDGFAEAVILFDPDGHVRHANQGGKLVLAGLERHGRLDTRSLLPRLGRRGGRVERLQAGEVFLGHAVYLPAPDRDGGHTLAARERAAIVETLHATGWRLTETARRLGISRTTLWRRLRDYGLRPDGDGGVG